MMDSNNIRLRINGIIDSNVLKQVTSVVKYDANNLSEIIVFCAYSDFDIPQGHKFSQILNVNNEILYSANFILEGITQEFFKPFDHIPRGFKTICKFKFIDSAVPMAVKSLPIIRNWYDHQSYLIFAG